MADDMDPAGFSYLTPDRFRELLKELSLDQSGSGPAFFGVKERTVRRWADGSKAIPRAVALLLELMVAYKIEPSYLKRLNVDDYNDGEAE